MTKTPISKKTEQEIYQQWEETGKFKPNNTLKEKFSIVAPPPNVTGNLHIGHALNNTIQDIIIRYNRMINKKVLWLPGTDHAGIATQMLVEKMLGEKNKFRKNMNRDEFLSHVWEWKKKYGNKITKQNKSLGSSLDWSRERFTMDDGLSNSVVKAFVKLYNDGLIYKDKRLVNWDPKLKTAISDLEVIQKETKGEIWYFSYPIDGEKNKTITIATTRPETVFGDTAIAVHPSDKRYTKLIGKFCVQPLNSRKIPIIADEYPDPLQGSGAVKITPAHDFNDYEVGKRNNLKVINILDKSAKMNKNCPNKYVGLDRFECRKKVIADMDEKGYLEKTEEHINSIPYGDRSNVVIEPLLTDQWYLDAKKIAEPAIQSVKKGNIKFVPQNWENIYYKWMENIQPWCISRQLWWGHQIPVWYADDGTLFVAETKKDAIKKAELHFNSKNIELKQDEDVLDTWFSSSLWPFATMGWPEKTNDLKEFYPTNILSTAPDIIFFWVARMIMMAMYFTKKEPFNTVFIHPLVMDENGAKMSKSKGNVVDPLTIADEYGADALRLTLTSLTTHSKDIKFSKSRVDGSKNLITKLYNSARFCKLTNVSSDENYDFSNLKMPFNKWIIEEFLKIEKNYIEAINTYKFNELAQTMQNFVRNIFCDWYIEIIKPVLWGDQDNILSETKNVCALIMQSMLKLLHPICPFITEYLWKDFSNSEKMLIDEKWPDINNFKANTNSNYNYIINLISKIRSIRSELNIPNAKKINISFLCNDKKEKIFIEENIQTIENLAKLNNIEFISNEIKNSINFIYKNIVVYIPIDKIIDVPIEIERLDKLITKNCNEIKSIESRLNSAGFIKNAPADVIEKNKKDLLDIKNIVDKAKASKEKFINIKTS